jgi:hypothetical protein
MAGKKKNVVGFKKFSDIKKSKVEEVNLSTGITPDSSSDIPMNPNLSRKSHKIEKPAKTDNLTPFKQDVDLPSDDTMGKLSAEKDKVKVKSDDEKNDDDTKNEEVKTIGKVAKFPKNVKASKAYNFLENVKVPKKSIWYIMVEKQDNELQMVKYNYKEGVNLSEFVNELKTYYIQNNKKDDKVCEAISKIGVDGTDKFSKITNIPPVEVNGKKMITVITEDLIKLLSK